MSDKKANEFVKLPPMQTAMLDSLLAAAKAISDAGFLAEARRVTDWLGREQLAVAKMHETLKANSTALVQAAGLIQNEYAAAMKSMVTSHEQQFGEMAAAATRIVPTLPGLATDQAKGLQEAVERMANSITINTAVVDMLEQMDLTATTTWETQRDGDRFGIKRVTDSTKAVVSASAVEKT